MLKRKQGFTLIELLAVIVILALIMVIATPMVLKVIEDAKKGAFKNSAYGIIKAAEYSYSLQIMNNDNIEEMEYQYIDGVETSVMGNNNLDYKGNPPQNGTIVINKKGEIALALHDGKYCIEKDYHSDEVVIIKKSLEDCLSDFKLVDISGANQPKLVQGMTPVIWDETNKNWIVASNIDNPYKQNWYDYEHKKWANARTDDGSFWVWIPRYAYKIGNNFHTNIADTIDIKFLKGTTNSARDETTIEISGYEIGVKDTSNHYFLHPAFKFGNDDILGFWVAKFEPSGSGDNISIKPDEVPLVDQDLKTQYNLAFNMKNDSKFGWENATVDTHMAKNIEWGAIAYLTQSKHGKNDTLLTNNEHLTGRGIYYSSSLSQTTTGTIYGIYDIRGCSSEIVMANFLTKDSNDQYKRTIGDSGFLQSELDEIDSKYIDEYTEYNGEIFGDAVYETSFDDNNQNSWHNEYSDFPTSNNPWFLRGGFFGDGPTGAFFFRNADGDVGVNLYRTFRPIVICQ